MSEQSKKRTTAFGIGCFHFSFHKQPPFEFTGSQYIQELKQVLGEITNLSNLKIDADDEFLEEKF